MDLDVLCPVSRVRGGQESLVAGADHLWPVWAEPRSSQLADVISLDGPLYCTAVEQLGTTALTNYV